MTSPVSRPSDPAAEPSPGMGTLADTPYLISDYLVRDLRQVMLKVAANEGKL